VDTDPGSPETNQWVHRAKLMAGDTAISGGEFLGGSVRRFGNATRPSA
jgi:hypothetical protein